MVTNGGAAKACILTSWKEIANYFGKGVRTVQRWELQMGLPVRRPEGSQNKNRVLAHCDELDAWLESNWCSRPASPGENGNGQNRTHINMDDVRSLNQELRETNHLLRLQLRETINALLSNCEALVKNRQLPIGLNSSLSSDLPVQDRPLLPLSSGGEDALAKTA